MRSFRASGLPGEGCIGELVATFGAVFGAALMVGIAVTLLSMLMVLAARRADAQPVVQPVTLPLLPSSVAFDAAGNLYFSDTNRQEVYESSLAGVLSVVAGTGVQGFAGDGGSATGAELNSPQGVAVGPDGTLYIADTGNQRIRAVSGGIITTFAGSGSVGFGGDGVAATSALFRGPTALAMDESGALLICDEGNQRVRRISAGVIQTVVGDGTQGFSGDGGAATQAELDTPTGVAVGPDGRIFVADAHNERIRVIATNGTISTFAGNGIAGYAGDGGVATVAELAMPRGLMVTAAAAVIFADSNNQRIRMVNAAGTITTIAGSGVQGSASEGVSATSSAMNSPRGVAVSKFGAPVYADALNRLVRESLASGLLYMPAGLAPWRTSTVTLSTNSTLNSGQTSVAVTVAGSAGTAQGTVDLLDAGAVIAQTTLAGGTATFAPQALSPGSHSLSVAYMGDGVNPAATSAVSSLSVGDDVITVTANPASMEYGQAVPPLTGSLSGELPQGSAGVFLTYTTTAGPTSPVGSYPILATLSGPGSANYTVVMSAASGSLQIEPAATVALEQALTQGSYTGLPLLMNASVSSTTQGIPSGTVTFLDNGIVVTSVPLVNGVATGTYLSPGQGSHSIEASYSGDTNFETSVSQPQTTLVSAMPDFTVVSSGSTTQTVAGGQVATYAMTVGAQSGAFTGVVDLSASGFPAGATATFSPPQVVPGATSATVTMSVQTSASVTASVHSAWSGGSVWVCLICPLVMLGWRRRRVWKAVVMCGSLLGAVALSGCGARSISSAALGGQTYVVTVTGTSTNLVGAVVSHSTQVTLVVE